MFCIAVSSFISKRFKIVSASLWTSCGTQRLLRPLSGPCILLATAPTAPPCIPSFVALRHLPPAGGSLWPQAAVVAVAITAELLFLFSCLSRPAGRSKHIFTGGVAAGKCIFRCATAASRQQQDAVCRCGLSCEKANWKNPQIFPICNP